MLVIHIHYRTVSTQQILQQGTLSSPVLSYQENKREILGHWVGRCGRQILYEGSGCWMLSLDHCCVDWRPLCCSVCLATLPLSAGLMYVIMVTTMWTVATRTHYVCSC